VNASQLKAWAVDSGIRGVKTFAQTLVSLVGLHAVNVVNVDWRTDLGISAGALVVSVLQNIQRLPYTTPAPSVVDTPDPAAVADAAPAAAEPAAEPAAPTA
jgi:hypothetical protein